VRSIIGGERGIRTPDTVPRIHAFEACGFNHSPISPLRSAPEWLADCRYGIVAISAQRACSAILNESEAWGTTALVPGGWPHNHFRQVLGEHHVGRPQQHGVVGLTRTAPLECIHHGIRVNAVNPRLIWHGATSTVAMTQIAIQRKRTARWSSGWSMRATSNTEKDVAGKINRKQTYPCHSFRPRLFWRRDQWR
jgi:hypothetical protein